MNNKIYNLGYVFIVMAILVSLIYDSPEDIIESSTSLTNFLPTVLYLIYKPFGIWLTNLILLPVGVVLVVIKWQIIRKGNK